MDIFERDLAGEAISIHDPEFFKIKHVIDEAQKILAQLNPVSYTHLDVYKRQVWENGERVSG